VDRKSLRRDRRVERALPRIHSVQKAYLLRKQISLIASNNKWVHARGPFIYNHRRAFTHLTWHPWKCHVTSISRYRKSARVEMRRNNATESMLYDRARFWWICNFTCGYYVSKRIETNAILLIYRSPINCKYSNLNDQATMACYAILL